ncbi:MAG: bifunctional 2-polyprenyl-6-hydroxyphenol methylase/3-demethylubiquinol 3-O-methyltransferase UbiG [Propylenella sp.]
MQPNPAGIGRTVDPSEVAKFERMAAEWWDADGKFAPLHKFNPVRLGYIRDVVVEHFARDAKLGRPLSGLRLVDIGCGGGLLCEPMARLGATVVGIDPSTVNVEAARRHAAKAGLDIDYRAKTAEALAEAGKAFDVVLAMEVVEHVSDIDAFLAACAALTRPGGILFVATINRTLKAFALAIVGAEYVLRWLPRGTHDYDRLVRPAELEAALAKAGLAVAHSTGVIYNPLSDRWSRSTDMDVNYIVVASKPAG